MFSIIGTARSLTLPSLAVLLLGCAIRLHPDAIVPSVHSQQRHEGSVVLQTDGAVVGGMTLSAADFFRAHHQALVTSEVFSEVSDDPETADYLLEVRLINVRSPARGISMTAAVTSRWRLTAVGPGGQSFDEILTTPYTATVGDAFAGPTRVRLAMEGALRESIRSGITWLSGLDL